MLPDDQNAVAEREALGRVGGNRGVECSMPDSDAGRSGDYPPNVQVVPVPHLDAEGQVSGDVVQVGVRQFAQKLVYPLVQGTRIAPKLGGLRAQLFEQGEGVELAIGVVVHGNER